MAITERINNTTPTHTVSMIVDKYLAPRAYIHHLYCKFLGDIRGSCYLHFVRDDGPSAQLTVPIEWSWPCERIDPLITAFETGITLLGGAPRG